MAKDKETKMSERSLTPDPELETDFLCSREKKM
jgi:hypothetical protein